MKKFRILMEVEIDYDDGQMADLAGYACATASTMRAAMMSGDLPICGDQYPKISDVELCGFEGLQS